MNERIIQWKRVAKVVLLILLLSAVGMTKMYADVTIGNLNYSLNSYSLTATVTGHKDGTSATGNLIIPSSVTYGGQTYSVTSIDNCAFENCSGFTGSLNIPNTVTWIGGYAFENCSGFTGNLIIPNSVTTMGGCVFNGCSGFTGSLTIGNSVTSIGNGVFSDCSGLTGNLTIPNSVTSIGNYAFRDCSGLTGSVTIPNSVTSIGYNPFSGCTGLEQIIVASNNTIYDSRNNCNAIIETNTNTLISGCKNTVIPNSVTTINPSAFLNCSSFTGQLVIPNSVTTIGSDAFHGCSGLTGNLTIPNSVTSIGYQAFMECSGFTGSLTISNSLTTIEEGTFRECSSFTGSLTIPNSVTTIGSMAFYHCSGFTSNLTIPNSVTTIGGGAFTGCSGFTGSLTIPNSVTSIGNVAFKGCIGFTGSLTIPNSVTTIGDGAFSDCSGFTDSLTIPNSVTTINETAFSDCSGFTGSLVIPNSVTTIGYCAFSGCSGFTGSLTIPNSVTAISISAFHDCSGFTGSLAIPNSVTTIGEGAFWGCSGFTGNLIIPNSVTTIGGYAFYGCSGLTGNLTVPNSVTMIGNYTFHGCSGLTGNLTIPNSVISIGNNAFFDCSGFTGSLTIPNSVTTIGNNAFFDCSGFTGSLIIPNSVTTIGNYAFWGCSNFTSITVLAEAPPVIGSYVFIGVPKSIPVYVPVGTIAAYHAAQGWSEFTNYHEIETTSYTITASANPAEGGSVIGGGSYTQGTTCTLIATVNEGYNFVNWTENNEVVSTNASYSFTVSGNRNLVANFTLSGTITNHWTPESANYSEIMAMYTVIQIDGVEQYSNMLEVGVFCGDECRGSAIAAEFNLTHSYLAILNVFGENGHQLTFKLYDHSIGQELNLTSPTTVTFDVNGYGNPMEPYVLNFTSTITHSQALNSGWNWWSTYIEQNGIDGLGMLENSIGSAGVRIQGRNGTIDQFEYQGSSYWYGSLTSIENEQMYKIRTNAACNAVMVGNMTLPANHPITINGGWNWIGFPSSQNVSVDVAMSGFTPEANDVIKSRNGSTTYVSYGSSSLWYGTLNTLEPGQGYMYKSNSNTSKTLVFQTGRGEETVTNVTEENSFFTPNTDDFSDNMLVTAVIDMDGQELRSEDYEVAAYVGNECRGSVRLMYMEPFDRYVAFLLVFGEAEEEIHFVLTDGNDVSWSDDLLTYTADGMEGTLTEPATLHFGTLGLNDNEHDFVNVFPNPSNGVFNIEGNGIHKIEVVNTFGQTIFSREVENNLMQIDLGDKAAGVYLLRVITNNGITTKQLIKKE